MIRASVLLAFFCVAASAADPPSVTGVLNDADFTPRVSPGTLVQIYGTGFGSGPNSSVTVMVGPQLGYTTFVSPNTLIAQVPIDAPTGAVNLTVTVGGQTSAPFLMTVDTYAPAIFSQNNLGTGFGLFFQSSSSTPVTATAPAKPGDTISLYAIGLGLTNPVTATGAVGVSNQLNDKATVSVGGLPASISYSGSSPGQIGLYQVNFVVPQNLKGSVPVVLTIGAKNSNSVDLPLAGSIKTINAASLTEGPIAADAYLAAQGVGLASGAGAVGISANPPYQTTFGGTTVKVKDSAGVERLAQISYVSAGQVNYILPTGTANGPANITVTAADGTISTGTITVATVSPGLFVYSPTNIAAANVIRARNGVVTAEVTYATSGQTLIPNPIDLGPTTDTVALVLYGTGIRGRSGLNNVTLTVGTLTVPVDYAGAQGQYPGLDQVNITLPRSLAGKGDVAIQLTVDGKAANPVHVTMK